MECRQCKDSPVCKAQIDVYKARLKMIHIANDQFDHGKTRELLNDFEQFLHNMNYIVTEA